VEVGKGTREGIWKAKRGIYNRAGLGNTRSEQKNTSRSKHIELCNRGNVANKV